MRNVLALSFAASIVLAFAAGCSHETTSSAPSSTDDVSTKTPAPAPADHAPASVAGGTTVVHGRFAETSIALDNAQALAIADDQTTYSASLDGNGNFSLSLPSGASYRIVFVNQLAGGGQVKIGNLAFRSGDQISNWFGANAPGNIDVGTILGNGNGGADTSDHGNDPSTSKDDGRSAGGAKDGAAQNVPLGAINVCLIWPSIQVYAGVDVGGAWADLAADQHAIANPSLDDDKNCAYWKGPDNATIWGAPWSTAASGEVLLAGGGLVTADTGFGPGNFGGYFKNQGEGFAIGFGIGGGVNVDLGGAANAIGGAATAVGGAISGAIDTAVNDVEGTVNTAVNDAEGTVATIGNALSSVKVGSGVSVGADIGVAAGVTFSDGWAVGVGAGIEGDLCVTAATCGATLSCVANACASR